MSGKRKSSPKQDEKPKMMVTPARLTNDMRNLFIGAVMADVPEVDYETQIRDLAMTIALARLPKEVLAIYKDPKLSSYVHTSNVYLGHNDGLPRHKGMTFCNMPCSSAGPLNEDDEDATLQKAIANGVHALVRLWQEQIEARDGLRSKLHAVAYHCTTTLKLAEAFPEFARYLPQSEREATRNLPALANVVADFMRAGWPKEKQSERRAR